MQLDIPLLPLRIDVLPPFPLRIQGRALPPFRFTIRGAMLVVGLPGVLSPVVGHSIRLGNLAIDHARQARIDTAN
jgi:hypothetical protein